MAARPITELDRRDDTGRHRRPEPAGDPGGARQEWWRRALADRARLAVWAMLAMRGNPIVFVILSGIVFFGWGEIFSLFPSTLTDLFGTRYATTNYGFLYIAQGVGSVLGGPVAAYIREATGSWTPVFVIVIVLDVITALLAVTVLRTLRKRWIAHSAASSVTAAASATPA